MTIANSTQIKIYSFLLILLAIPYFVGAQTDRGIAKPTTSRVDQVQSVSETNHPTGTAEVTNKTEATAETTIEASPKTTSDVTAPVPVKKNSATSPSPRPAPAPTPLSAPTSVAANATPKEPNNLNIPAIAAALVLATVAIGIGASRAVRKSKENKNQKEQDGQKCDSIKSLLDAKKKELEDMAREWPKEKLREMAQDKILGTLKKNEKVEKVLNTIEGAKEKYDKLQAAVEMLQKKYDLCVRELPARGLTARAVIFDLHGVLLQDYEEETAKMISLARELKKKGIKIFILSNSTAEAAADYERRFPFLREITDNIYYSSRTGFTKPDGRAYELILKENSLKPEECFYFDDSDNNVEAANKLGIRAFLFKGPEKTRTLLE